MRYAFWPGCVSKGACPELYRSIMAVAPPLGLELVELTEASCTGAGVVSEQNPELADTLNARTFPRPQSLVPRPIAGLRVGPFYGCYILRPSAVVSDGKPRDTYLELVIEALGADPVDYRGMTKRGGCPA